MVIAVTGEGGVGKSTLLAQYESIAKSTDNNARVVICDDRQTSPVAAMSYIAGKLAESGTECRDFNVRLKKYREMCQEIEGDQKVPRSLVNLLALGVSDFTIKSLRKAPGVGVLFEYADEKAAGEAFAQLVDYGISRWGNKDEVQLLREPEKILTPLFLTLLNNATEDRPLVLMFDVFERTHHTLAPWLLALCKFEYGVFNTGLSIVISGRDPLEQHWTDLAGALCHVTLEPFILDETKLFLSNQGITDEQLVAQIHADTAGLPVLVELLAATKPQPGIPLPDISRDAVERFLQWTPQEEQRQVALLAAVPRQFNNDILTAAIGKDADKAFNWLAEQSYIRTSKERGWFYHEKVRELMLRHFRNTNPGDLTAAHKRLAEFYDEQQHHLNLEDKLAYESELWKKFELEKIFHWLCEQPFRRVNEAVNSFLGAFRWQWKFSEKIVHVCEQTASESALVEIKECAERMGAFYRAYEKDEYATLISQADFLLQRGNLIPIAQSTLFGHRAEAYRMINKSELALADFDHAIELDAKYAWAITSRGQTYHQMGRYEQALADFGHAIELDAKYAWAIASRGETYGKLGRFEQALADFDRAIELDKKNTWAITRRGIVFFQIGKYDQALADFDCAIELGEHNCWVYEMRGQVLTELGHNKDAVLSFTRAIRASAQQTPKGCWACIASRGETYRLMGKYKQALVDFDRAIGLDEKSAWAIASRGKTYRLLGKHEQALADFDRAIELDDKNASIIANRGDTYRLLGKHEQALADFDRAIELDEKSAWAIASRGKTYRLLGKHEQALPDFDRAIELDDKNASIIASRGQTYQQMGKHEQALADFDRAIELDEKYAWAIANRGETYRLMGKYMLALADYIHVIELDSENPSYRYNMATIYIQLHRFDDARRELNERMKLKPDNTFAPLISLGIIARHQGLPESGELFQQALAQWETAWREKLQTPAGLLESKAKALLCTDNKADAVRVLAESIAQMSLGDKIEFDDYTLLKTAPVPPDGIDEMITMLKEVQEH